MVYKSRSGFISVLFSSRPYEGSEESVPPALTRSAPVKRKASELFRSQTIIPPTPNCDADFLYARVQSTARRKDIGFEKHDPLVRPAYPQPRPQLPAPIHVIKHGDLWL